MTPPANAAGAAPAAQPTPAQNPSVLPPENPPGTSESKKGTAPSAPANPNISPAPETTQKWRFTLRGLGGGARLGGPAGGVFGHDFAPPNQSWDHTRWGLTTAVSYKLFDPNKYFQLWVGGQAGFLNFSGNENSPGQLNGAEFGAHGAIASRGLYQNKTIQGPELGLYLGGFFARGKSTAGNNFSVDSTSGAGFLLRPSLSPLSVQLGTAKLAPEIFLETSSIPHARGSANAPFLSVGGALAVHWGFGKKIPVPVEKCDTLESRTRTLIQDVKTLREAVTSAYGEFNATSELLKKGGFTAEKMRDALRAGYVEKLKADAQGKLEKEGKKPAEVRQTLQKNEEDYKAQAKVQFADSFNYYQIGLPPMDTALDETGVFPSGKCVDLDALFEKLNNEKIALEKAATQIDERKKLLLFALGNPPSKVTKVVSHLGGLAFAQFPPINFNVGRPDYPGPRHADMSRVQSFVQANQGRAPLSPNDPGLQRAFKGIFAGNELPALKEVADQLNGLKDLRGVRLKGLKPEEVRALVRTVTVLVQALSSVTDGTPEGNLTLSNNRAAAVVAALTLFGVDPARLRPEGKGLTEPIV